MSEVLIRVSGLGKRYRLGTGGPVYQTLRESVTRALAAPFRGLSARFRSPERAAARAREVDDTLWALKDVSFEVREGEVLGIVGRNGAGKSTLLKILSRITEPTEGRVQIRGRVGSLLEVGTGFHPELTGRENIYLNGAILGMRRREIEAKFDQIVAFAEVERFLDTPVKRYSSGMYVRLAFAVAAHLEPEILLVDEVLAVGDAAFQRKCLGKMDEVSRTGRTVLFVSHYMPAITSLCPRAIWLHDGSVCQDGAASTVVSEYLRQSETTARGALSDRQDRSGDGRLRVSGWSVRAPGGSLQTGSPCVLRVQYEVPGGEILRNVALSISFSRNGRSVLVFWTETSGANLPEVSNQGFLDCHVDSWPLLPGHYSVNLYCTVNDVVADYVQEAATVHVVEGPSLSGGRIDHPEHPPYYTPHRWLPSGRPREASPGTGGDLV